VRICVHGLWHLGCVTAACLSDAGLATVGLDDDAARVADLRRGIAPLFEPGLAELIAHGQQSGRLSFTAEADRAVAGSDLVWVAFDTPVDDDDRADTDFVVARVERLFPHVRDQATVAVSSQLPVGSVRALADRFAAVASGRRVGFACVPENLRLGNAIAAFRSADRFVVGVDDSPDGRRASAALESILGRFSSNIVFTSLESAEVVKHALNSYLASAIALTNEIATICELVGADAEQVERGIRTDPRIGTKAYVRAGPAFAGGTLARDVTMLIDIAARVGLDVPALRAILASNQAHRMWAARRLAECIGPLVGRKIAVLGLAYKMGTSAIRRSTAIEMCRWLLGAGAEVRAFDPAVQSLPADLHGVRIVGAAEDAIDGADALVIATDWPQFATLDPDTVVRRMASPLIIDQFRLLAPAIAGDARIRYVTVGTKS